MATNLALRSGLLDHAFRVSGEPTKKAAVQPAPAGVHRAAPEQRQVRSSFGKARVGSAATTDKGPNVIASCELLFDTSVWVARLSAVMGTAGACLRWVPRGPRLQVPTRSSATDGAPWKVLQGFGRAQKTS